MSFKVLVVDDQKDIASLIALHLTDIDCEANVVTDGEMALTAIDAQDYDVAILDVVLPGIDGFELCRRIRSRSERVRVIMLTARAAELDRVTGLEIGADDYVTKPFSIAELVSRVKVQLRRLKTEASPAPSDTITRGEMTIEPKRRAISIGGRSAELTAMEFDLLVYLASDPGRVSTRADLLAAVWGYSHSGYEHTVNSHINRLRRKIEPDPQNPRFIHTVWGVGYKFADTLQ